MNPFMCRSCFYKFDTCLKNYCDLISGVQKTASRFVLVGGGSELHVLKYPSPLNGLLLVQRKRPAVFSSDQESKRTCTYVSYCY